MNILLWLLFGALVGWIAKKVLNLSMSLPWTIGLGIAGSVVGGMIASLFRMGGPLHGRSFDLRNIALSVIGSCLVVWLVGKLRR